MQRVMNLGVCALVAALAAPMASAGLSGTVNATLDDVFGRNIKVSGGGRTNTNVRVGIATFNKNSSTDDGDRLGDTYVGFCVDLEDAIQTGNTYDWNVVNPDEVPETPYGPIGSAKANRLSKLWGNFYSELATGNNGDRKNKSAAFQLAVWEIVYESELTASSAYDVTSGYTAGTTGLDSGFQANNASNAVADIANNWLRSLDSKSGGVQLAGLTSDTQDFITNFPIPEPSAILLGLIGFAAIARRR